MKSKKSTSTANAKLDKEIKKLFLVNPLMNIKVCMQTLENLDNLKLKEKRDWVKKLNKEREDFLLNAIMDKDEIKKKLIRHINSWESHVGALQLDDILEIIDGTPFNLVDVAFDKLSPLSIANLLEKYLIGQHEYAQKLSLSFYLHIMRNNNHDVGVPNLNLLAYGPSGTGKTFGPQILSKIFGFKLGVVNCNNLVQEGIHGPHISDTLKEIYDDTEDDVEEVEKAVILFDEFDKLFSRGEFNERVLHELLNFIDDDNSVTFSNGYNDVVRVSTKNMLFIFSGVFSGIEDVVRKRMGCSGLGFSKVSAPEIKGDYHDYVRDEDFATYFNRDELAGRIMQYAHVNIMTEEVMVNILLNSKGSPLHFYVNYFKNKNINLELTEDGAKAIAAVANKKHLGVRGLKSTIFKVLSQDMYNLDKEEIIVDRDLVEKKTA